MNAHVGFDGARALISFLFEFIPAPVVVAVIAAIVPLLEFLISLVPVIAIVIAPVVPFALAVVFGTEALDEGSVGELQLAIGQIGQFALDRVVMHGLFMPVVIGQLHVIGDGIGETAA